MSGRGVGDGGKPDRPGTSTSRPRGRSGGSGPPIGQGAITRSDRTRAQAARRTAQSAASRQELEGGATLCRDRNGLSWRLTCPGLRPRWFLELENALARHRQWLAGRRRAEEVRP